MASRLRPAKDTSEMRFDCPLCSTIAAILCASSSAGVQSPFGREVNKEVYMPAISRREFLKYSATSAAAAGLFSASALEIRASPLGLPIGCQTWAVKEMIAKDFPATIKLLAETGFQAIELCSPVGYAEYGFAGLAKYSGSEIRKILADAGGTCVSSHFGMKELRDNQAARLAWGQDVGLTHINRRRLG